MLARESALSDKLSSLKPTKRQAKTQLIQESKRKRQEVSQGNQELLPPTSGYLPTSTPTHTASFGQTAAGGATSYGSVPTSQWNGEIYYEQEQGATTYDNGLYGYDMLHSPLSSHSSSGSYYQENLPQQLQQQLQQQQQPLVASGQPGYEQPISASFQCAMPVYESCDDTSSLTSSSGYSSEDYGYFNGYLPPPQSLDVSQAASQQDSGFYTTSSEIFSVFESTLNGGAAPVDLLYDEESPATSTSRPTSWRQAVTSSRRIISSSSRRRITTTATREWITCGTFRWTRLTTNQPAQAQIPFTARGSADLLLLDSHHSSVVLVLS